MKLIEFMLRREGILSYYFTKATAILNSLVFFLMLSFIVFLKIFFASERYSNTSLDFPKNYP